MDKKLQLIRHLYGEAEDRSELNKLLEESDLQKEYQALSEAKFWLDHSKREKPSPDVLQHILQLTVSPDSPPAAAPAPRMDSVRPDREALPRQKTSRRIVFGRVSLVMATLVTAILGYQWYFSGAGPLSAPMLEQSVAEGDALDESIATEAAPLDASSRMDQPSTELRSTLEKESLGGALAEQPEEALNRQNQQFATPSAQSLADVQPATAPLLADSSLPDWDKVDDVIRYKQRIEMLLKQNEDLTWDQPVVPLESLPGSGPLDQRLRQARSRASGNRN